MSGRAAKFGAELQDEYYARCLDKTKTFNHIDHRYEVDPLEEMKCHVMKREISLMFLEKMRADFSDKSNNDKIWALVNS